MKLTESQLNKMIENAIDEYHIKNANGNYTRYNFSDYARNGGGVNGKTFGNIHNNPNDFYGRKYTNKQNALNPEMARGQQGQETWVYKMIQRENRLHKSLGQELGALDRKIKGYVRKGYFGKDPDIVNLVNVYSAFLHYTSRKYEYFIAQYRNRNQQAMAGVDYGSTDSLEEAQSIYGLNTENGTNWITELEQQIRGLIDEGVFRGKRTMEINNDFLELLRLGRLGKPTVAQATPQDQQLQLGNAGHADEVPGQPTQPGEEGLKTGDKYADNIGNGFENVQPEDSGVATGFNDPAVAQRIRGAKDEYNNPQTQRVGKDGRRRKLFLGALIGLTMLIGAALGLRGCEGQAKTVVPPANDTEIVDQTPQTQDVIVNFDNMQSQLSQEEMTKLQNLDKEQQYNVIVKGNVYQWHIGSKPCDPETNQQLQQNLDNQRANTIKQILPNANVTIQQADSEQASATINGGNAGTVNFDDAQQMMQQQGGNQNQMQENKKNMAKIRINESDIAKIVECCVKKINEMDDYFNDNNVIPYDTIKQAIENGAPESVVMELIKQYARTSSPELMAQPEEVMAEPAGLEEAVDRAVNQVLKEMLG